MRPITLTFRTKRNKFFPSCPAIFFCLSEKGFEMWYLVNQILLPLWRDHRTSFLSSPHILLKWGQLMRPRVYVWLKTCYNAFILHLISESSLDSLNKTHTYKYKLLMYRVKNNKPRQGKYYVYKRKPTMK